MPHEGLYALQRRALTSQLSGERMSKRMPSDSSQFRGPKCSMKSSQRDALGQRSAEGVRKHVAVAFLLREFDPQVGSDWNVATPVILGGIFGSLPSFPSGSRLDDKDEPLSKID